MGSVFRYADRHAVGRDAGADEARRLRLENAELLRRLGRAEQDRDTFAAVVRGIAFNPMADVDQLRHQAIAALKPAR
jgi:hypothetical protein